MITRNKFAVLYKIIITATIVSLFTIVGISQAAFALPTTGVIDTTFNPGGTNFNNGVTSTAVQPDGKVLVGGTFTSYATSNGAVTANRIIRLNPDGSVDTSFNTGTGLTDPSAGPLVSADAILVLPDGSILIGGNFNNYNNGPVSAGNRNVTHLIKLSSTGVLDTTFVANLGTVVGKVTTLTLLSSGDIIVGGQMIGVNGSTIGAIFKIDAAGHVNTAFNANIGSGFTLGGGTGAVTVLGCVELNNGNLLIGGSSLNYLYDSSTVIHNIAVIGADGTPVSAANLALSAGANSGIYSVFKQSDGKVVIAGDFNNFKGVPQGRIVRLLTNGYDVDTTFNNAGNGTGFNARVEKIAVDANDNVFVATNSASTTFNGVATTQLLKLTPAGAIDTSFVGATVSGGVGVIKPTTSGDVYVGGFFTLFKGTTVNRFMRLTVGPPSILPGTQNISVNVNDPISSSAITASGFSGTVTYSISPNLPAGLSFDPATGIISGYPTGSLTATAFTITGTDGTRSATSSIVLAVQGSSNTGTGNSSGSSNGTTLAITGMSNSLFVASGALGISLVILGGVMVFARRMNKQ